MQTVASLCAGLEIHLKQIKICHAQCEHLVQTLSKGIQKMIEIYANVSQSDIALWKLYESRKLRNLVSSLDSLVISLRSAKNLLPKCGSDWKKMALVVSMPVQSGMKTCSEFNLLMGELHWKLAVIEYFLYLGKESDVEWKWCTRACRFELIVTNKETGGGEAEDDTCSRLSTDRDKLMHCLEDGSIFSQNKLNWLQRRKCFPKFARDEVGEAFGTVLKRRLTIEPFVYSSSDLKSFEINHLDFKCLAKISSGAAKKVYRGEWLGQEVAIAIMGSARDIPDLENRVKKEAGILLELQHPNIVPCYGYSYTHNAPLPASKHRPTPAGYLVLELMEEDLGRTMNSTGRFSISVALDILLQIVEAMVHSHEHNIIHRDLKPGNCLVKRRSIPSSNPQVLDVNYDVKLTDFGSAKIVDPGDAKSKKSANRGTTCWVAPEMVRPPGNYTAEYRKSTDVYGFAMICYQVITGIVPYDDELKNTCKSDVLQAVSEGKLRPTFPSSLSCPEGLKQLMRDCWDHDADSRPDFKEIQRRLWSVRKDEELG